MDLTKAISKMVSVILCLPLAANPMGPQPPRHTIASVQTAWTPVYGRPPFSFNH